MTQTGQLSQTLTITTFDCILRAGSIDKIGGYDEVL